MARLPSRLAGPAALTTSAATKYTAPAYPSGSNLKTVVRHIHFYNANTTTARLVTLSIGTDAAGTRLLDAYSIPPSSPLDLFGYYPLAASEIVQAFQGTGTDVVLTIAGDENC